MKILIFLLAWFIFFAGQAPPLDTTITIPTKTYTPGTYNLPETALPVGISIFTLRIDRVSSDANTLLVFKVDLSSDSGNTWNTGDKNQGWCAFSAKDGRVTTSVASCYCLTVTGCNSTLSTNKVRGTVTISNGNVTAGGSLLIR